MATLEVTQNNLQEVLHGNDIVLLDFWASWCGPCRQFGPIFEASSNKHTDIVFGKIDTEDQTELARTINIRSIPTLMIFRDGIQVYDQPGALPAEALDELISQTKALDMDKIRKQITDQQSNKEQSN